MRCVALEALEGATHFQSQDRIDREALKQVILEEYGTIHNDQPVAPGTSFLADLPPLAYDPEWAKELLAEAGYPEGLEVTLSVAEILPRMVGAAVVLQEMMKAANITVTIDKVTTDKATQTKVQGLVASGTHIRPEEVWLAL